MQRIAVVLACFLALAASACSSLGGRYFREGIGTDLYWSGLPEATRFQELYLGFICQQAELPTVVDGSAVLCAYTGMTPPEWGLFVQAGMNDIDRRCDAYLAWLDDKRRVREPVLKQLADMGAATAGILQATNAGAAPIAIAGIAFGLAADTFTNVTSRLLLEIDHSTVQAVVLDYQSKFRATNAKVIIDNRPAAIYLLRAYLRLCMPYSIETSINTTITIYHRDPAALVMPPLLLRTPVAPRLQTAQGLSESVPHGGSLGPIPGVGGQGSPGVGGQGSKAPRDFAQGARTPVESKISKFDLETIQMNLCVTPTGRFDDNATRMAIQQAKYGNRSSGRSSFDNKDDEIKTQAELSFFTRAQACSKDRAGSDRGYQTAFEKFAFTSQGEISSLQIALASSRCDPTLKQSGRFDKETRAAIELAKKNLIRDTKKELADRDTSTLNDKSYDAIILYCH